MHHVLIVDEHAFLVAGGAPGFQDGFEFFLRLLLLVAHGGGAFEILLFDRLFLARLELLDLLLQMFHIGRAGHGFDARAGARFVHDVDGFVRQEPAGDIAIGKFHGGLDGGVRHLGFVMVFVFRPETFQNLDGFIDGRSLHFDVLEAAFQRGVLLNILAVLVECGGADALQLAPAQGGFDDVRGVHRAFGRAGAHDGVQLVDEQNDVFGAPDFVHHSFDALFKLAAVLGAGHHERQVEGDDAFLAQQLGHVALGNFLSQTFDDGGFAHASLTEQHGVVLGAAAQNLDDPLNLVLAADDGVHLPLAGDFCQIPAKGFEGGGFDVAFLFFFAGRARRFTRWSRRFFGHVVVRVQLLQDFLASLLDVDVQILQHAGGHAVPLAQEAKEQVFGAHIGVIQCLGFFAGQRQDFLHPGGVRNGADDFLIRPRAHFLFHFQADRFQIQTQSLQHVDGHALAQLDQPQQQMLGAQVIMVQPIRLFARQCQHLLGARRKIIQPFFAFFIFTHTL